MTLKDDTETLTFRLPTALKSAVERFADSRGDTVTAVVRDALLQCIAPVDRRLYQLPGFSSNLDALLADAQRGAKRLMILVTREREPNRLYFEGVVDPNFTNASLVAIRRQGDTPWIIPRCDIVGWYDGPVAMQKKLGIALNRLGWAGRTEDKG
jgi:predicted transcriptional regulator